MPSAGASVPPQLDPTDTHSGCMLLWGVIKPSGLSAFSPLSCFWFRTLQTNHKGKPPASLPKSEFVLPLSGLPSAAAVAWLPPELLEIRLGMCSQGLLLECLFHSPLRPHLSP